MSHQIKSEKLFRIHLNIPVTQRSFGISQQTRKDWVLWTFKVMCVKMKIIL